MPPLRRCRVRTRSTASFCSSEGNTTTVASARFSAIYSACKSGALARAHRECRRGRALFPKEGLKPEAHIRCSHQFLSLKAHAGAYFALARAGARVLSVCDPIICFACARWRVTPVGLTSHTATGLAATGAGRALDGRPENPPSPARHLWRRVHVANSDTILPLRRHVVTEVPCCQRRGGVRRAGMGLQR
jgi:hypothetical protein